MGVRERNNRFVRYGSSRIHLCFSISRWKDWASTLSVAKSGLPHGRHVPGYPRNASLSAVYYQYNCSSSSSSRFDVPGILVERTVWFPHNHAREQPEHIQQGGVRVGLTRRHRLGLLTSATYKPLSSELCAATTVPSSLQRYCCDYCRQYHAKTSVPLGNDPYITNQCLGLPELPNIPARVCGHVYVWCCPGHIYHTENTISHLNHNWD